MSTLRWPQFVGLTVLAGAAAFLYQQTFADFLRHADNDASAGDRVGTYVLRIVPLVLFPAIAVLVGLLAWLWTKRRLIPSLYAAAACALTLEFLAVLWLAARVRR